MLRDEWGALSIDAGPASSLAEHEGALVEAELRVVEDDFHWLSFEIVATPKDTLSALAHGKGLEESDHDAGWRRADALRLRHRAKRALERFFDERGFLEVETSSAVPSPGLDLHLEAFPVECDGAARYLITSPEYQMKRLLAGGYGRIMQLGRCYRAGERGPHHEPEFVMCEWYRAFAGAEELMADTETLVAFVAETCLGTTRLASGIDVAAPWPRRQCAELFAEHGLNMDALDDDAFFRAWVERIEPSFDGEPFFVTGWPPRMASLARIDERTGLADRFEAYLGGVELCNGFGELVDPVEQHARLVRDQEQRRDAGLPVYPLDERFVGALEEGLPPSGGNALGFDRLVMLLAGAESLQDVVALPAARL